jgi:hypothetical protein
LTGPEFEAQSRALQRAVAEGILSEAERDSVMDTVASSYSGGIAYQPFDVLEHVLKHPRFPEVLGLRAQL